MATWEQIIADPVFQDLDTSSQATIRQEWYDSTVLPALVATGVNRDAINAVRQKDITEYDNGQGYISSFASAAGRGAASTFTSAVQGVGALTGSEAIEQAARDMSTAVTENLTVNPTMEKTNFAGNVLGNVAGFLVPGTLGMRVGKAAGMGAQLGGQIASNAAIIASGAGSGAQTADQYGIQGPERMGMVLGNAATELISERIPFGLGSELKSMGRLAGLGEDAAKRTGGFFSDVGQNAVEEMAANTGSNLVTSAFVPEGVQTPGIFEGNLEAAAGGAIGGAFFGGINLMAPAAPKPSEVIVEGATQRAMAGNDAEAAAEIPGAKLQPTAAPQVPGAAAFDPTLSEQLAPAAGELPPPAGFAETTPPEAFPAALPQGLPAAAAVPGAVPEAFPAAPAETSPPAPAGALPAADALPELDISLQAGAYTGDLLQGKEVIGEGSESTVYKDGDTVIKVSEPYNDNSEETFQARVDRAMDIDNLIGDGTLSVEGFYRSKNGTKNPVFRQTFAEGRPATREEIQGYMESRGFQVKEAGTTTDTFVKVSEGVEITASDLDGANVLVGTDGKFHVIDADLVRRPAPNQTAPTQGAMPAVPPTGETLVAGRFTGVTEAPPTELFHSGELPEGLDSIDPMRTTGAKQGKRGRDFGGFYAGPAETAAKYKGPKNRLTIAPGARAMRVVARGAIERLSLKDRQDLLDQGVDIISGIDIRGLPESVILNKDVILSVELDTQTAPAAPAAAVPTMTEQAPPVTPQTPPITPAVAAQGATPSDLIDQTGRLTVEGAQSMIEAIQSLGLTTAPFVINNTGVAPGVTAPPAAGSTRPVDGTPTIFLNRERMTLDTPLHETTHLLTPTLLAEQPDLYAAGAALLANSPLRQAIANRYVTEAGMTMSPEQITEEAMVTGLANNGAEWLRAYAGNAKMTRAIKEFLAKVREWFDKLMYSKGFDPNMSLEQFYKKVNRQMLAGKLQQRATNAPVQAMSLDAPSQPDNLSTLNESTDPRTSQPTLITGPTFNEGRRADVSRANRSRMEQARRLGDELAKRGANPADVRQAIESSGIPVVSLADIGVERKTDGELVVLDASLRRLPAGAEARPFADDGAGVVYKLFPTKEESNQNGVKLAPKKGPDGWTVDSAPATALETLEKIALLHDIGGAPSEIVGITGDGDILVKQPLLSALTPDQKANFAPVREQAVNSVNGKMLKGRKFKDVRLVTHEGKSYFVGDLHTGNVMLDANGNPVIMDALVSPVPDRMRYDEAELDTAIKQTTPKPTTTSPDIRFSLAPAVTKPSNVARNQAGTRVRVLMENQTYEGQTIPAAMEQALSLYDANVDKDFTVAQHMAFIQELRLNAKGKYQDMTYGAYAGMYTRDLLDESTNPERDPMSQAFAKRESDRIAALMGEQAAIPGRQVKAMDIFDRIANTPEMTVRREEQLLPFDGKQNIKDEFDKAATTAREEMEGLANEAINTAPEDAMTSAINQQVAAVAKGEETSNVGEVVLDEVKPAETLEDLPEWFRKGQDALGEKLSAIIDEITTRIALSAYLNRKDGTYSLSAEERSANLAKLIKQIEDSGQTVEQAKAENNKRITELTRELNKTQAKAKPKAAPVPKEAPPEGEIQDIVAARINRLLDKIVKPSTSPAKTRTDKEVLVDAIVSTMMAKAGLPADLKAGGDNVTLAFGLVVANPELAAQSVQAVYDLLQSDPASANITSSDKIRGFMQMMTGQSFADGKAYGEKQLNTVLKNELKRLKISVNDVAMDAALTGKTVEQLEAALRDPSRELSKVLSADALNKVVAAVTGEFRKTAAERADGIRSQQAQARVLQDMIDEKNMVIADFKAARAKKKKAAEDAKKETKEYEDLWTRLKNGEDKAATRQAERQVRAAQAAEMKAEADWAAHQSAESEAISEEAQRSSRDLMEQQNKLNTTDRKFRLALNRKARKAMRRKLAKRGGFMIPLDQTEADELLDQKPKTVLQYLAREYGFSLTDIIGMARDQDRQATLEAKVGKLAQALGLTKEQADKFMGPVIAEGMKHISEARKKDVSQRINRVLTPVIGKKKTQKTEAEKLIKLAEMGGLTADNVEKLLLNSKDAKEFTKEFRQELIDLIAQANDPHLTQISRDLLTGKFLDKIKAARGITVLGLLGEWTMSNIFMSILSTFKVNFVWGFIKAASDSGIFITISGPAAARADAIAKGVTPAPRLAVSKVLFRQWLRGYAVNMQHNAAFMWSEGRGKDESDFTSQFANTGMELLSRIKDAQIQWSNDGKVLPQSAQKVIKAMAAFGKYTRRTMVASDFINRTSAFEMSKVLEAVKVMQAKGGAASTATIQREIDDALYGGSFKDAFAKANKQADDEIAAKKLNKPERGIRVGEIMDEMLGKNLGMTEKQTQEYLQDSRENAKRWSLANQTEGIFGEISNLMLAATRKFPGLKFSLPAVRMPIAAFSQTLDWTPYGFLRLYAIDKNSNETESFTNYLFNSKNEYGNWNKPVGGVPAYRKTDLMAKATIGSLIMIGLCIKAFLSFDEDEDKADFYITGLGPSDPAENKAWREKGNAPFTFRFNGGTGFRFQESPFYGMLAPIAAWSDAHRYGKPGEAESDRIAYAMGKTLSGFQEAVVMKNLSDILAGGSSYSADGQLRNWSKATSRLASNVLMPRLGGEINTILYGPQDQKALGWGGRALANVPFVPSFNNKPAQDFLGREIHTKREGMLGEIYPALAHRVLAPSLDDPILNFVAKMSPNFLATTRRFKDGTRVMDNYEFVRKWNAAAGVKIREYLTPERMASFERKLAKDKPDAQTEFNVEINKIRTAALRKFSEVQF